MDLKKLDAVSLLFLRRSAVSSQMLYGGHDGERAYRPDLWDRVLSRVEATLKAKHIPFGNEGPARDLEDAFLFLMVEQYPEQKAANEALAQGEG